ncbi:MAG: LPS export ABC transporter periplasmic protein LptC [Chitinophagales bacterium]|nr:LPS export ABC transporter periplasmic protein LptC [Chitinophagales bacterium]
MKKYFYLFFVLIMCISCQENDIATINALIKDDEVGVEIADSVKLIYKENEFIRAEITTKTVKRYIESQNKLEFTKGMVVKFYEGLKLTSVLTADYGILDDTKQTIEVKGNIVMQNYKHEVLKTENLVWNLINKTIYAQDKISIKTPYDIITGYGLNAKEDFSNYSIKRVTGIVSYNEDESFR